MSLLNVGGKGAYGFLLDYGAAFTVGATAAKENGAFSYISLHGSKPEDRIQGINPSSLLANVQFPGCR
jgi:hypothetical protein